MEITHYVGVKFNSAGKAYYFGTDISDLKIGDKIVAESIRGLQVGEVASLPVEIEKYSSSLELKPVIRRATEDDILLTPLHSK